MIRIPGLLAIIGIKASRRRQFKPSRERRLPVSEFGIHN
jgi:hypothetical protein